MYTITLGDGTLIENVTIDYGMCYVERALSYADFEGKLYIATIAKTADDPEGVEPGIQPGIYKNMTVKELCECRAKPGFMMFRLEFMSKQELHDMSVEARLDYLEMMIEPDFLEEG